MKKIEDIPYLAYNLMNFGVLLQEDVGFEEFDFEGNIGEINFYNHEKN